MWIEQASLCVWQPGQLCEQSVLGDQGPRGVETLVPSPHLAGQEASPRGGVWLVPESHGPSSQTHQDLPTPFTPKFESFKHSQIVAKLAKW